MANKKFYITFSYDTFVIGMGQQVAFDIAYLSLKDKKAAKFLGQGIFKKSFDKYEQA